MKTVIIVSKCLRVTKISPKWGLYEFHFKGVYAGEVLKRVFLKGDFSLQISKGEEYLIYLKIHSFENESLRGEVLKFKRLDECWDKS